MLAGFGEKVTAEKIDAAPIPRGTSGRKESEYGTHR